MTDVQIFCNEEIKKSHEKFTQTLVRTISLISSTISTDKIDEGEAQLMSINKDIDNKLIQLRELKEKETKILQDKVNFKHDHPCSNSNTTNSNNNCSSTDTTTTMIDN